MAKKWGERMQFLRQIFAGIGAPLRVSSSPLYRYPYRDSMQALAGDWKRVGKDIAASVDSEARDYE